MKRGYIFLIIFLLIIIRDTNAFLLQPPTIEIDFKPGLIYNFSYMVGGHKGDSPINIRMYPVGDLNERIILHETSAVINTSEWKGFSGEIILPNELKPGLHDNGVIVEETKPGSETAIGSIAGSKIQLYVRVPYPGKYIEAQISANNIKIGESAEFLISMINRGNQKIERANALIEVSNPNGDKIDSIKTEEVSINPGETVKLNKKWDSKNQNAGLYFTKANIDYDGNKAETDTSFRIGDLIIKIISINGTTVDKGSISKITTTIQSMWNEKIDNVYAQLDVDTNKGRISVKSESIIVNPFSADILNIYLDTKNIDAGKYPTQITVFYSGLTTKKDFTLNIQENNLKKIISTQNILILVIIILVIILLFNLKRFKKKKIRR